MTIPTKTDEKKIIVKKLSPFQVDPHNHRGGKGGIKNNFDKGRHQTKSINVPKFKGGSGGDR